MKTIASPLLILLGLLLHQGSAPAETARPPASTTPAAPHAADGTARVAAREALADGNRRLKAGDLAGAIEAYHRAQSLYPPAAAKIEFNIAKAEEARGDTPGAAAAFERCLAQELELPDELRKEARDGLARLAAGLGTLRVDQERAGLSILVDGQARAQTPLEHGLWVRPGRHVVTLEKEDRVMFRDTVEIAAGTVARVGAALPPEDEGAKPTSPPLALVPPATGPPALISPPAEPTTPRTDEPPSASADRPIWKRWWFWTGIAAVAAAGTATVLILKARADDCSGAGTTFCRDAQLN